jgi:hypothetical protein
MPEYVPLNRWFVGSQSRQRVKDGHESRGIRNQELLRCRGPARICYATVYWRELVSPIIVAKGRNSKHFPVATNICW